MEAISGKRLGMHDTAFGMTPSMRARLAVTHLREADCSLRPMREMVLPQEPKVHMGGHGIYSTVDDHMRLIDVVGDRCLRDHTN